MDLRDTPEEAQFRAEVRAWIQDNLPGELRGHRGGAARFEGAALRAWSRALSDAGYPGLTWPAEYGGRGAPYSFQAIFYEEMALAEAPPHVGVIGLGMAGPTIMAHGTAAQKERYLAKILSAEEIWCQGFSEPGAGSDLAAVRTSAEIHDDHTFCPSTTNLPFSSRALVRTPARSEPAPGSEKPWHQISSAERIGCR